MTKKKTWLLLVLIIALGFFLRIYRIDSAPPGVYPDEAVNGMDAISAMHGDWQWFYPANNGREGLFMNLIAICFKLFGISVLTLKLPSVIFGTLTIWGVYLLGSELFRNKRVGLISAFLVSVGFWAINFSRISFRANTLPTILAFSFYFLFRGARTKKWYDFALGGLIFGIGLHTYISFRIAPLVLVVMLFVLIINRKHFISGYWKNVTLFVVATAITAAPMLYTFFISHPEYWQSRTSEISILNPEANHGHLLQTFLKTFSLSLVKYNFWGDQNWRHNFPPYGILDPLTGIAFLFGLIYATIKMFHLFYLRFKKGIHDEKLEIYTFLLSLFFLMLVPEFMAAEGNPHALRAIGTLPVVFILAGMTFNYFFEYAERYGKVFQKVTFGLMAVILVTIGFFNSIKYHVVWANRIEAANSFDRNLMEVSDYMKTLPQSEHKYVMAEVMERIPIQLFNQNRPDIEYFYPGQAQYLTPTDNNFILILTYRNDEAIAALEQKFPEMQLEEKNDGKGTSFWIMKN